MTYIWNRANRVPDNAMPDVLVESFRKWAKERYKILNKVSDSKKKKSMLTTIAKQTLNYQDALSSHKNKVNKND